MNRISPRPDIAVPSERHVKDGDRSSTASRFAFLVPGDIDRVSGGYAYARALLREWAAAGDTVDLIALPGDFPDPSEASLKETARILGTMPSTMPMLVDGLAYGALPADIIAPVRAPITVLLHHPLGLESGLSDARAKALLATEKAALCHARHVVVTSAHTAREVERLFAVSSEKITVALPGTAKRERGSRRASPPVILSVASITPRKGHADLIAALAEISDLEWTASFIGSKAFDPGYAAEIESAVAAAGLSHRITLTGEVSADALDQAFANASLFALPSHYEGYGMAFAEAMSAGLPIVGCRAGAVPDVVPPDAGFLVEPGDRNALATALRTLLTDTHAARRMGDMAFAHAASLPDWTATSRIVRQAVLTEGAMNDR